MTFSSSYRISIYVMLVLAALIFNVDAARDNPLSLLYAPGVAIACVAAYFTVDRRADRGMSRTLANILGFGAFGLAALEFWAGFQFGRELLVLAMGHWLIYLEVIKILLPKTDEDDWFLFLLALVQVVVGTFLSQSDEVGFVLLAWILSTLWALGLFHLHREARRQQARPGVSIVPEPALGDPYPGLIDPPFIYAALRVAVVTLALGGIIFWFLPRSDSVTTDPRSVSSQHLTGFTNEVRLGQLGEILESEAVVMSVELTDEQGNRTAPIGEPRWRGLTLVEYRDKRWFRQEIEMTRTLSNPSPRDRPTLRQRIRLEPSDNEILFGRRPIVSVTSSRREPPVMNPSDGSIYRPSVNRLSREYELRARSQTRAYDYVVVSGLDENQVQQGELFPFTETIEDRLLMIPDQFSGLRGRLRAIADAQLRDVARKDPRSRARALEGYLRDSGQFHYTLQLGVEDPGLDPVEDFLTRRKRGHCEYFASALTLLLRSEGIPARMVNGFKGGDWNDLASVMTVRQKHAHSWVEALIGSDVEGRPIWLTLDPTPARERDASVAQVGGFFSFLRPITDFIRYIWVFYVVGFDADRQNRVLYTPIKTLFQRARDGFLLIGRWTREIVEWVYDLFTSTRINSIEGAFLVLAVLVFLAGLGAVAWWLVRRLFRWYRGPRETVSALAIGVAFYLRAARLLGEYGLERPPTETPREFARRASAFLAGRGLEAEAVADVPSLVVDAFYRVRFGHRELSSEVLRHLEIRLDALEASLLGNRAH